MFGFSQPCRTKYSILLVHGVFYREDYWGRIPEALRKKGAVVHHSGHQATAAVADSGAEEMDKLNFDWKFGEGDFKFTPGDIELTVTQRPEVIIKYIGGPIYVPPSSDPNYEPVDVRG